MVTGKLALMRAQRRWADAHGVRYDAYGCVRELADNLRAPLCAESLAELERGSELKPRVLQPARFYSLCSSAALVVNVFGYWRGRDQTPLLRALGAGGRGSSTLAFEHPLPTGLAGDPPTADVVLYRPDARCVAVESKFAEWLAPRPRGKPAFKDKYFPDGSAVWADAGLPRCQALAEELQAGRERLKFFNAPQLLKHALGLAKNGLATSALVYLYYDRPGKEAAAHRAEIERVLARLGAELELHAVTYQVLFDVLRADGEIEHGYLDYLEQRYFR